MQLFDYKNVPCDHLISYQEFIDKFVYWYIESCHDFKSDSFLFDEGGALGFSDVRVGFRTVDDVAKYRKWLKETPEPYRAGYHS